MEIFLFLSDKGEKAVREIVHNIKLTQPTVSYHLKEMEKNGILKSHRSGKEVFYQVSGSCPHLSQSCILKLSRVNNVR